MGQGRTWWVGGGVDRARDRRIEGGRRYKKKDRTMKCVCVGWWGQESTLALKQQTTNNANDVRLREWVIWCLSVLIKTKVTLWFIVARAVWQINRDNPFSTSSSSFFSDARELTDASTLPVLQCRYSYMCTCVCKYVCGMGFFFFLRLWWWAVKHRSVVHSSKGGEAHTSFPWQHYASLANVSTSTYLSH